VFFWRRTMYELSPETQRWKIGLGLGGLLIRDISGGKEKKTAFVSLG
jgi:hypothetical protein